ncbi:hypothetical protein ADICYQ_0661 [Cyclobacterium qasimii M12-11B]|uniref:PilZ domain-containing protein n=1 Tax=Cyclobacterium qasimii M12-11B TaxID=641524 RepID=S7VLI4_9BACT|nr:hypothetical protein ADICYQ_0661 [Cyclobacterium qasimii M12-11B]
MSILIKGISAKRKLYRPVSACKISMSFNDGLHPSLVDITLSGLKIKIKNKPTWRNITEL